MCRHGLTVRQSPAGKEVKPGAEDSTLLGTVTEQQLVKSITDGEFNVSCSENSNV
jgi:hypothetical protein